jgi:uncharacterized iron-regulated membrane protein
VPKAPRGAFLRGHWAGVLTAITVMVALGLFLPLLGWSLLAFITLDTAIGTGQQRRRTRLVASSPATERGLPESTPLR